MRRRRARLLCSLLLTVVAGAGTAASSASASASPASPAPPASAAADAAASIPLDRVVPAPASVRSVEGSYAISPDTRIRVSGADRSARPARRVGDYLAGLLRPSTGYRLPVTTRSGDDGIRLRLTPDAAGVRKLGEEGYRLEVTGRAITLSARSSAGLFHGVQTLRQLLPTSVERTTRQAGPWRVSRGTITDVPRYAWRGAMLDVSRHFFGVDKVKRYIDQLALYKINTLHLHLSDDQGWRIAVDSWPRLTTYGGSTQVGGGPGGYYTKDDYREIVSYAASRELTVVPEIDMPGHTNAALASYAELNCDGVAPPLYTGTEVGFSSLCVPKEVTYDFVDDVIRELAALTPGPYLHIGGDEAHSTSHEDYVAFMDRVQPVVAKYGKTVVGWHQLTGAHPAKGAIAQYWGTDGSEKEVAEAAKAGTRLVLSPANRAYLDMKYDANTPLGQSWAGYVEAKQSYDWDPGTYIKDAPASSVLGVEAPLWTETLETSSHIEYMAFPRLPGIAELGWAPASAHDWDEYKVRVAAQGPRWDALGIEYYHSPQIPWPND
ncbi:beta-N-acetylhexosaminidase [Streptomyces malaysiensis subsp. malaysiensis]|uniref:beta-N-acetylhexosaminidase n=1 Tax=Streptomyces malaysiensis TaxID=92644 RepID=UPI000BFB2BC6|nr:beta-N-acetylhexosaminidase [Streptomyces malaysiensis]ATL83045.1 beta-N-acetylhexosaminidase [Streptomyces malaysiensis]QDL72761.1 beta-N-acetylhexosaminidase [Streptomyces malaysiensis]